MSESVPFGLLNPHVGGPEHDAWNAGAHADRARCLRIIRDVLDPGKDRADICKRIAPDEFRPTEPADPIASALADAAQQRIAEMKK